MPSLVEIINWELYIFQSGEAQISWLGKGFPIRNLIIRFSFVKKKKNCNGLGLTCWRRDLPFHFVSVLV